MGDNCSASFHWSMAATDNLKLCVTIVSCPGRCAFRSKYPGSEFSFHQRSSSSFFMQQTNPSWIDWHHFRWQTKLATLSLVVHVYLRSVASEVAWLSTKVSGKFAKVGQRKEWMNPQKRPLWLSTEACQGSLDPSSLNHDKAKGQTWLCNAWTNRDWIQHLFFCNSCHHDRLRLWNGFHCWSSHQNLIQSYLWSLYMCVLWGVACCG